MKKYRVICNPNWESWGVEVEAENVQDAIEEAETIANQNCSFMATEEDVCEIEESNDAINNEGVKE